MGGLGVAKRTRGPKDRVGGHLGLSLGELFWKVRE